MSHEQIDLNFLNENGEEKPEKQEEVEKNLERVLKPDDDLSFNCEVCMDREGGCPTCGWGRNI